MLRGASRAPREAFDGVVRVAVGDTVVTPAVAVTR
jgi:hypothetical protein